MQGSAAFMNNGKNFGTCETLTSVESDTTGLKDPAYTSAIPKDTQNFLKRLRKGQGCFDGLYQLVRKSGYPPKKLNMAYPEQKNIASRPENVSSKPEIAHCLE